MQKIKRAPIRPPTTEMILMMVVTGVCTWVAQFLQIFDGVSLDVHALPTEFHESAYLQVVQVRSSRLT